MAPVDPVTVGRIVAVHGVRGWVKVQSATEPQDNILTYQPWWLCVAGHWQSFEVDAHRIVDKGLLCHLKGIDDRDVARGLCQQDIAVEKSSLPALAKDEYYWHQLQGMQVVSHWQGREVELGSVKELLATGANDVLVVAGGGSGGDSGGKNSRERLIPYIDQVVTDVDLATGRIDVEWDPDF